MNTLQLWYHPAPFTLDWHVGPTDIDHYGHVNNVAYLTQLEKTAWAHTNALGLTLDHYRELDRAMVIKRHELNYLQACHEGDALVCATWIVQCDNRLSLSREFQFICPRRQKTVFTATTQFVCTSMTTGAPKRMPEIFRTVYGKASIVDNPVK